MTDREPRDDLTLLSEQVARLARKQRSPLARGKPVAWSFGPCKGGCNQRHGYVKGRFHRWYGIDMDEGGWSICYMDASDYEPWWRHGGSHEYGAWEDGAAPCVQALVNLDECKGPLEATEHPNVVHRYGIALFDCDDEYLCDAWLQQALREN